MAGGAGLRTLACLLRGCHDAVAGFRPPGELAWFTGETGVGDDQVICHGDFGPWNIVWRGACPIGILDRGYTRPAHRMHDIACALEYAAPFRDDADACAGCAVPSRPAGATGWRNSPPPTA